VTHRGYILPPSEVELGSVDLLLLKIYRCVVIGTILTLTVWSVFSIYALLIYAVFIALLALALVVIPHRRTRRYFEQHGFNQVSIHGPGFGPQQPSGPWWHSRLERSGDVCCSSGEELRFNLSFSGAWLTLIHPTVTCDVWLNEDDVGEPLSRVLKNLRMLPDLKHIGCEYS